MAMHAYLRRFLVSFFSFFKDNFSMSFQQVKPNAYRVKTECIVSKTQPDHVPPKYNEMLRSTTLKNDNSAQATAAVKTPLRVMRRNVISKYLFTYFRKVNQNLFLGFLRVMVNSMKRLSIKISHFSTSFTFYWRYSLVSFLFIVSWRLLLFPG